MNYELVLKLKEAGFHKLQRAQPIFLDVDHTMPAFRRDDIPTLEELIEACGDKFCSLEWDLDPDKIWVAFPREEFLHGAASYGATPTEAVARLWLALNKK